MGGLFDGSGADGGSTTPLTVGARQGIYDTAIAQALGGPSGPQQLNNAIGQGAPNDFGPNGAASQWGQDMNQQLGAMLRPDGLPLDADKGKPEQKKKYPLLPIPESAAPPPPNWSQAARPAKSWGPGDYLAMASQNLYVPGTRR